MLPKYLEESDDSKFRIPSCGSDPAEHGAPLGLPNRLFVQHDIACFAYYDYLGPYTPKV